MPECCDNGRVGSVTNLSAIQTGNARSSLRAELLTVRKIARTAVQRGDDDGRDGSAGAFSSASADDATDSRSEPSAGQSDADWRSFRAKLIKTETSSKGAQAGDAAAGRSLQEVLLHWFEGLACPMRTIHAGLRALL